MHLYIESTKILRFANTRLLRNPYDSGIRGWAAFLLCLLCAGTGRRLTAQSPTTTQLTIAAMRELEHFRQPSAARGSKVADQSQGLLPAGINR
jgi:hypothetical protein